RRAGARGSAPGLSARVPGAGRAPGLPGTSRCSGRTAWGEFPGPEAKVSTPLKERADVSVRSRAGPLPAHSAHHVDQLDVHAVEKGVMVARPHDSSSSTVEFDPIVSKSWGTIARGVRRRAGGSRLRPGEAPPGRGPRGRGGRDASPGRPRRKPADGGSRAGSAT